MATALKKKFNSFYHKLKKIGHPFLYGAGFVLQPPKSQKLSKILESYEPKKPRKISIRVKKLESVFDKAKSSKLTLQKKIVHAIGQVYLSPERYYLPRYDFYISKERVLNLYKKLEPGDIIIQSRKWRGSNLGIRGFWKHVVLFTGTFEEMDKYFEKEAKKLFGKKFSKHVKDIFPDLYYDKKIEVDGLQSRTIESLAEGVVVLGLQRTDYMAALRPRVGKKKKMLAILKTFEQYRKPYDYTFDFLSDEMLVCSELVAKAYLPCCEGDEGLDFDMTWNVMGRWMLKANDLVEQFARDYKTDAQQFDFVAFLDGEEDGDVYIFMDSYKR